MVIMNARNARSPGSRGGGMAPFLGARSYQQTELRRPGEGSDNAWKTSILGGANSIHLRCPRYAPSSLAARWTSKPPRLLGKVQRPRNRILSACIPTAALRHHPQGYPLPPVRSRFQARRQRERRRSIPSHPRKFRDQHLSPTRTSRSLKFHRFPPPRPLACRHHPSPHRRRIPASTCCRLASFRADHDRWLQQTPRSREMEELGRYYRCPRPR